MFNDVALTTIQKKICMLGEFAVGKTSLVRRYVEGRFDDRYLSTIGVKISRRSMERPYGKLSLLLWDLAGSEEFNGEIRKNYLRGASGILIVCDMTRRETMAGYRRYMEQIQDVGLQIPVVFVANKVDMHANLAISRPEIQTIAADYQVPHFFTSAKTGENVEEVFLQMVAMLNL